MCKYEDNVLNVSIEHISNLKVKKVFHNIIPYDVDKNVIKKVPC